MKDHPHCISNHQSTIVDTSSSKYPLVCTGRWHTVLNSSLLWKVMLSGHILHFFFPRLTHTYCIPKQQQQSILPTKTLMPQSIRCCMRWAKSTSIGFVEINCHCVCFLFAHIHYLQMFQHCFLLPSMALGYQVSFVAVCWVLWHHNDLLPLFYNAFFLVCLILCICWVSWHHDDLIALLYIVFLLVCDIVYLHVSEPWLWGVG